MKTSFEPRAVGDITVINITGRLTLGDPASGLRDAIARADTQGPAKVILNLGGLDYIDSAGLGELLDANRRCQLKLVNVPKRVVDLMRLSQTHSLFDVCTDESDAITGFL